MFNFLRNRNFFYPLVLWLIVFLWYLVIFPLFEPLRLQTGDLFSSQAFYLFSQPPQESSEIAIVAIDDFSLQKLDLKWPWKRSVTARLLKAIASYEPRAVGFDVVFSGTSRPEEDAELVSALSGFSPVVLACVLKQGPDQMPDPMFARAATSTGFVNRPTGEGLLVGNAVSTGSKVVRNTRTYYAGDDGANVYSIDIELLAAWQGISREEIRLVPDQGIMLGKGFSVPADEVLPLNYLVHPREMNIIPAVQVMEKKVPLAALKDKLVLVGTTAPLIHDEHVTPLGIFPGVTIIANSLTMMLSSRFLFIIPLWQILVLALAGGTSIVWLNNRFSFALATLLSVLMLGCTIVAGLYLRARDIQFDYFTFFFLLATAYLTVLLYKYGSLIYFGNRMKNLAVRDHLTGFYTPRYFLLKTDEKLRDRSKEAVVFTLRIDNYQQIVLSLDFNEVKNVLKTAADYIGVQFGRDFPGIFFSRLSVDMFAGTARNIRKEEAEKKINDFLANSSRVTFKAADKVFPLIFSCMAVHKPRNGFLDSKGLLSRLHSLSKEKTDDFVGQCRWIEANEVVWDMNRQATPSDMLDFLVSDVESRNKELETMLKDLLESKKETEEAYFDTIRALIKALEEKDTYTQGHSERVARYARAIARKTGLSDQECDFLYKAGLLHDIGKIGVPDYILRKKERLTDEDYNMIRRHVLISGEILKPLKPFHDLIPVIVAHHERFDGTGYPYGLGGDMIPQGAQILATVDAFDAITCGRGYKKGLTVAEALQEMEKGRGSQFNPVYVDILKEVIASGELKLSF